VILLDYAALSGGMLFRQTLQVVGGDLNFPAPKNLNFLGNPQGNRIIN
jgi:hypothetical protein